MTLKAPSLLTDAHDLNAFDSGVPSLDDWLRKRARANQSSGASRTYVVEDASRVVAFYCLSSGAMALIEAPGKIKRNMPDPVPLVVLGRLAVDKAHHKQGLAAALLKDAVLRTTQAAGILGIRGFLVHAISDDAKAFYEYHGFTASPTQPMTLVLSIKTA